MVGDILQPTHLIFILVIALLVLGPKRLPEVGKSLGRGLRDFRMAISGEEDHHDSYTAVEETRDEPEPTVTAATTPAPPAAPPEPTVTAPTPQAPPAPPPAAASVAPAASAPAAAAQVAPVPVAPAPAAPVAPAPEPAGTAAPNP